MTYSVVWQGVLAAVVPALLVEALTYRLKTFSCGTFSSWGHYHLKARMMEEQLSPDLPPDPFLGPHPKRNLFIFAQKESSGNLAMHQIVHYCAKCLYLKVV